MDCMDIAVWIMGLVVALFLAFSVYFGSIILVNWQWKRLNRKYNPNNKGE